METLKIVILGSQGVGKTTLKRSQITTTIDGTIMQYYTDIEVEGKTYRVEMLEFYEHMHSIRNAFFSNIHGFVVMYNITGLLSFDTVSHNIETILEAKGKDIGVPIVIAGNKCDLQPRRAISRTKGEATATKWGVPFYEISALQGTNVREMLTMLATQIVKYRTPKLSRKQQKKKEKDNKLKKKTEGRWSLPVPLPPQIHIDSSTLRETLADLYNNKQWSDVCFTIEEQKVYAHKAIISMFSEKLAKLMSDNRSEYSYPHMKLHEFSALIKWIYTGKIDNAVNSEPFSDTAFNFDVFNLAFALKNSGGAASAMTHEWDLETLFNSERFSDITFIVGHQRVHAHKVILASRCRYFGTLFTMCSQKEILILNVEYEAFVAAVRFLYADALEGTRLSDATIQGVAKLAQQWDLRRLMNFCEEALSDRLTVNNVARFLLFAKEVDATQLSRTCYHFITERYEFVKRSEDWKRIPKATRQVLKSNKLMNISRAQKRRSDKFIPWRRVMN